MEGRTPQQKGWHLLTLDTHSGPLKEGQTNRATSLSGSSRSSFLALEVQGSIFIVRLDVISTSPCGVKWDAKDTKEK